MKRILATKDEWVGLVTRLTIGIIILPHGLQKLFGMYGGFGFEGTMGFLTNTVHLPWIIAFTVIIIESVGAMSLIVGFASRVWAALMIVLMIGAINVAHLTNGFFMNWSGMQKGEGFEYHLLVIGLSIATLIVGSGKYSIDELIAKKA
jgi:putative oxidoreductase